MGDDTRASFAERPQSLVKFAVEDDSNEERHLQASLWLLKFFGLLVFFHVEGVPKNKPLPAY